MIIKSIALWLVLEFQFLENIEGEHVHQVYYESVIFKVHGKVEYDEKLKQNVIIWDTKDKFNWDNYLRAREDLAKTPIPKDLI